MWVKHIKEIQNTENDTFFSNYNKLNLEFYSQCYMTFIWTYDFLWTFAR